MSEKQEILKYSALLPEKKRSKTARKTPLEPIAPPKGSRKKRRRVGRGHSSGSGKTSGRGHKGQKARTGYSERAGFEGGQMPLHRRLPKRGFRNIFKVVYQEVNLYRIAKAGVSGELTPEKMQAAGLIRDPMLRIKILGTGEAKGALQITADAFTEGARKKIEGAGGSCTTRNLDELRKQSKKKAASE